MNETTIDNTEIEYIGDPTNVNGGSGNYNVFYNTDGLVQSRSIDLTHLYIFSQHLQTQTTGLMSVSA